MTLKEKFLNSPCELGYVNTNVHRAENNVKIADDYTIEFAKWVNKVSYRSFDGNWYLTQNEEDIKKTTEELLEIFKKEKGL